MPQTLTLAHSVAAKVRRGTDAFEQRNPGVPDDLTVVGPEADAGLVAKRARQRAPPPAGVDYHAPFGGSGASSYGPREQGRAARTFYTTSRTIYQRPL